MANNKSLDERIDEFRSQTNGTGRYQTTPEAARAEYQYQNYRQILAQSRLNTLKQNAAKATQAYDTAKSNPDPRIYGTDAWTSTTNPNVLTGMALNTMFGKRQDLTDAYKNMQEANDQYNAYKDAYDYNKAVSQYFGSFSAMSKAYENKINALRDPSKVPAGGSIKDQRKQAKDLENEYQRYKDYYDNMKREEEDQQLLAAWARSNPGNQASYTAAKTAYDKADKDLQELVAKKNTTDNSGYIVDDMAAAYISTGQQSDPGLDAKISEASRKRDQAQKILSYANAHQFDDIKRAPDFNLKADEGEQRFLQDKANTSGEFYGDKQLDATYQKQMADIEKYANDIGLTGEERQRYIQAAQESVAGDLSSYMPEKLGTVYTSEPDDSWTDEEKKNFYYLYATDPGRATQYANHVIQQHASGEAEERDLATQEWATRNAGNAALATVASVPAHLIGGNIDYVRMFNEQAERGGIYETQYDGMSRWGDTATSAIAQDLNNKYGTIDSGIPVIGGKGLGDVYQLGTSVLESGASIAAGGEVGSLLMFFGTAASSGVRDGLDRGLTGEQAVALGTLNGIAEVAGEVFSVENLLSNASIADFIRKGLAKELVKQGAVEASEEVFTTMLNTIADAVVSGDQSELQAKIYVNMANGMDYDEAKKQAVKDWVNELGQDALGGFLSGFVMSGAHAGGMALGASTTQYGGEYRQAARENELQIARLERQLATAEEADKAGIQQTIDQLKKETEGLNTTQQNRTQMLFEDARRTNEGSKSRKLADKYEARNQSRGSITNMQAMRLQATTQSELTAEDRPVLRNAVMNRLKEVGVTNSNAADIIVDRVLGVEKNRISEMSRDMVMDNAKVQQVYKELQDGLSGKTRDARWVQDIHTKIVGINSDVRQQKIREVKVGDKNVKVDRAVMQDGKFSFQYTEDGETKTVSLDDANLTEDQKQWIGILTDTLGDNAANAYATMQPEQGATARRTYEYASAFATVRDVFGRNGAKLEAALNSPLRRGLTEPQVLQAYTIGQQLAAEKLGETETREKSRRSKGVSLEGGTLEGQSYAPVSKEFRESEEGRELIDAVEQLSNSLEVPVILFESQADSSGKLVGANGAHYDGTIWIDVNAGMKNVNDTINRAVFNTMAHELTHFIQQNAPEQYEELKKFVLNYLQENMGQDYTKLVADKMVKQEGLSYEGALNEVVADACETMLRDSKYIKKMVDTKPTLFETIRNWLRKMFNKILARDEGAKALQPALAEAVKLWDAGLKEAVESRAPSAADVRRAIVEGAKSESAQQTKADRLIRQTQVANAALPVPRLMLPAHIEEQVPEAPKLTAKEKAAIKRRFDKAVNELIDAYQMDGIDLDRATAEKMVADYAAGNDGYYSLADQARETKQNKSRRQLQQEAMEAKENAANDGGRVQFMAREIEGLSDIKAEEKTVSIGMTDEERYNILKDKKITIYPYDQARFANLAEDDYAEAKKLLTGEYFGKTRAFNLLRKLGKSFSVFKEYHNRDISVSFEYSISSLRHSNNKQETAEAAAFAKMLTVFDKVIDSAVGIEVHGKRYEYEKKVYSPFDRMYVLFSAYKDGKEIVPVRAEVKTFTDATQSKLDVVITLSKINEADVIRDINLSAETEISSPQSASIYMLADILRNVNPADTGLLKYLPDGFLDEVRLEGKKKGQESTAGYIEEKDKRRVQQSSRDSNGMAFMKESTMLQYQQRTQERSDRQLLTEASETGLNAQQQKALQEYRQRVDAYIEREATVTEALREMDKLIRTGASKEELAKKRTRLSNLEARMGKALKELTAAEQGTSIQEILRRERENQRRRTRMQMNETLDKRELRKRVDSLHKKINGWVMHPSEKQHVPQSLMLQAIDVLEAINMDTTKAGSERGQNLRNKLLEFKQKYSEIQNDEDFRRAAMYDGYVAEMLDNMIETVGDTPINRMSVEQLHDVYNALTAVYETSRHALKVTINGEERDAYQISKQMTAETRSVPKPQKNFLHLWLNAQLSPERMFNKLGGYHKNSTWSQIYRMLDDGQLKQTRVAMEGSMLFEDLLADKQYEKFLDPKNTVDIGLKDADGKAIPITHGMLISLYMHLQNEQNARHVAYGGLTIPELKDYYNGKKSHAQSNAYRAVGELQNIAELRDQILTQMREGGDPEVIADLQAQLDEADLRSMDYVNSLREAIENALTDYDRQWIAASKELFDGFSKRQLNETTMEVYGIKRANVENYMPIWVDGDFLNTPFESVAKDMSLENAGFMKERVDSSKPPIRLADISDVTSSQIKKVSQYCGLMPAIRNFNKIWGKTQTGYRDSLQKAVNEQFGDSGVKYIENLMADLNGARGGSTGPLDEMLSRMRGRMAQASLTLSLRVAMGQAASYPTAAAVLGWEPLHKALWHGGRSNTMISRADQDLIRKWSPLLYYRMKGFSTPELGNIADMNSKWDRLWKKARWATGWIQAVDGATVGRLWYAAEYYVQDHNKALQKGSDAYYQEVAKVFNDVVEKTQPNYTTMQRPDILRNPSSLVKQLTMFLTQRLQNTNIVIDAAMQYSQAKKDYAAGGYGVTAEDVRQAGIASRRAVTSQLAAAATIAVFKFMADGILHSMNAYRDDDKDLTKESVSIELLDMFIDSLAGNVLGGSEVYDLVESKVFGKTYNGIEVTGVSTAVDLVTGANDFFSKVASGEATGKDVDRFAKKIGPVIGVPYANAAKIVNALRYHTEDIINGEFMSMEAGVDRTVGQEAHRLYRAYRDMDYGKVKKIREEVGAEKQKNLDAALVEYIKKQYDEKKITRYEAQRQLVKYAGKDADDAEKIMTKFIAKQETGMNYDEIDDKLQLGDISAEEARNALVKYGVDSDKATMKVEYWQYRNEHPDTFFTESSFGTYWNKYRSAGLTPLMYEEFHNQWDAVEGVDKNNDGKADSGSKKADRILLIDALPLTPAQKDEIYNANWKTGLDKAPWHK